jgi:protein PsiE
MTAPANLSAPPVQPDLVALPPIDPVEKEVAERAFHLVERFLLVTITLLTLGAVALELVRVYSARTVTLADILQLFLYTEVIGMVAVFYTRRGSPFAYPIFIAITALARLIVLQGKEMAPQNILFEALAIILLAISATIIVRMRRS